MRFKWGDTVRIASKAPSDLRPGLFGSVCGIRTIDSENLARLMKEQIGTVLLLIEFGDGHTVEIPERFLDQAESAEGPS
jgi:hypothetical protein